jgi:hypothetical protein
MEELVTPYINRPYAGVLAIKENGKNI